MICEIEKRRHVYALMVLEGLMLRLEESYHILCIICCHIIIIPQNSYSEDSKSDKPFLDQCIYP